MANIILSGLEPPVESSLLDVLRAEGHEVSVQDGWDFVRADAVFCNGDGPHYEALLDRIRNRRPDVPVVVVTRLPETEKWIGALEAGAADYCCAPFEPIQVRWIVSAVLGHASPAAVSWPRPGVRLTPSLEPRLREAAPAGYRARARRRTPKKISTL